MQPSVMLEQLLQLLLEVRKRVDVLTGEVNKIGAQYMTLKEKCGVREDDCAELMGKLTAPLTALGGYVNRCAEQIVKMKNDPFAFEKAREE
jgi:hypothetical protein